MRTSNISFLTKSVFAGVGLCIFVSAFFFLTFSFIHAAYQDDLDNYYQLIEGRGSYGEDAINQAFLARVKEIAEQKGLIDNARTTPTTVDFGYDYAVNAAGIPVLEEVYIQGEVIPLEVTGDGVLTDGERRNLFLYAEENNLTYPQFCETAADIKNAAESGENCEDSQKLVNYFEIIEGEGEFSDQEKFEAVSVRAQQIAQNAGLSPEEAETARAGMVRVNGEFPIINTVSYRPNGTEPLQSLEITRQNGLLTQTEWSNLEQYARSEGVANPEECQDSGALGHGAVRGENCQGDDTTVIGGNAEEEVSTPQSPQEQESSGLVPCSGTEADPCEFSDIIKLINDIITFLIVLAVPVSALLFAYAGFLYMTAAGSEEKVKKAHRVFTNVALGFGIMLSAWLIVHTITSVLLDDSINTFLG